ncbi:hypothetical protein GGD63_001095 [Bradyrhizobium sp. cir1]|uniref:DUF2235 domain-containing protein n=1 Tax=Bradyrhizobium sp. cir1 TaxID=1445730 RepID=UPI0016068831|nr:DUF2235 domain-containing protein [Bradyrhizobium sp. cir1]MBB4368316.1 hypothetical protein [Bradyrhizobium sp. cir1]
MPKRIILLLDGTWNDADDGPADTNIVRLRERIAAFLAGSARGAMAPPTGASRQTFQMSGAGKSATNNVVFYERGVGTSGFLDNLRGGAFGAGLDRNIRRAYTFLVQHYDPDDEIYIFGFSRGSYTARSLVGCLNTVGLLRREDCDEKTLSKIWSYYRTDRNDRTTQIGSELRAVSIEPEKVTIKCLGVFDTVGALGLPLSSFWKENRDLYGFHDVGLARICEHSLHAVAIDEHREQFEATLWRQQKFINNDPRVEQVWFPGAHADVGGGYIAEQSRRSDLQYLDDTTLDWMIRKVQDIASGDFPVAPCESVATVKRRTARSYADAPQHEPRRGVYRLFPYVLRSIWNKPVPVGPWPLERNVCFDRHATPIGEAVHISAILRLGQSITLEGAPSIYAPRNLLAAIYKLRQRQQTLAIVNWDGRQLNNARASTLLDDALHRTFLG